MNRIAVIAAMESELARLVEGWSRESLSTGKRIIQCFFKGDVIAAAGGIGTSSAEATARALVEKYRPEFLVSAGLAGALTDDLKAGSVVLPELVVDAATGAEYPCGNRSKSVAGGVLVTTAVVASKQTKSELAQKFHASAVDMEAAAVARAAHEKGIAFGCVKAISDECGFLMPPMGRFVCEGEFQTAAFLCWLAVSPRYWRPTVELARKSARANRALYEWLAFNLSPQFHTAELLH
jgi:adenosylhomocysteine nucleosidase